MDDLGMMIFLKMAQDIAELKSQLHRLEMAQNGKILTEQQVAHKQANVLEEYQVMIKKLGSSDRCEINIKSLSLMIGFKKLAYFVDYGFRSKFPPTQYKVLLLHIPQIKGNAIGKLQLGVPSLTEPQNAPHAVVKHTVYPTSGPLQQLSKALRAILVLPNTVVEPHTFVTTQVFGS